MPGIETAFMPPNQTISAKTDDVHSSPGSARSLLGNQSSTGSTSEAEFCDNQKKKDELNLYDWLSATNSPRQKSNSPEQKSGEINVMHSDFDQTKTCELIKSILQIECKFRTFYS